MKEMNNGRHIAPAILTRLPVAADRTKAVGNRQRILEGHVVVDGHDLTLIVGHWTSRLPSKTGNGSDKRMEYAEKMYGEANAIYHANPKADILLCGDFNDNPTDPSVTQGLHSVGDPRLLASPDGHLRLLGLFDNWRPNAGYGTLYYLVAGTCSTQFHVSPGMLGRLRDSSLRSCDPTTARNSAAYLAQPSDPAASALADSAMRRRKGVGGLQRSLPGDGGTAVSGTVTCLRAMPGNVGISVRPSLTNPDQNCESTRAHKADFGMAQESGLIGRRRRSGSSSTMISRRRTRRRPISARPAPARRGRRSSR